MQMCDLSQAACTVKQYMEGMSMCRRAAPLSATLHACPGLAWESSRKEDSVADFHQYMPVCEDSRLAHLVRVLPVLHKLVRLSLYGYVTLASFGDCLCK